MATFTRLSSVSSILTTIFSELGLTVPSSFIGNTDVTSAQLLSLFTAAGQDLCLMHDWQFLHQEQTITTDGTAYFALPDDWNGYVDGTFWNNTSRLPVIGPLTPQVWRMLKARLLGGNTISLQYRIVDDRGVFYYAPTAGQTLQLDYRSRGWLYDVDTTTLIYDNPQLDTNICRFDPRILVPLVKLRWREAKGFDTTAAQTEFENAWDIVIGQDIPAPTLSIAPSGYGYPYLGYNNIPDTNFGS